ncbi:MAG: glycosyl transferase group 1 [Caulobacteraceae bacterium]|nr:glycosyl transferase group 1 [Caulobacteraceae bacterium]
MSSQGLRIAYSFPFRLGYPGTGAAALGQIRALATRGCKVRLFCRYAPEPIEGVEFVEVGKAVPLPQRWLGARVACRLHDRLTASLLARSPDAFDVVHTWPLAAESTLAAAHARGALAVREAPNTHTGHAFEVVAEAHRALKVPQPSNNSHTFSGDVLRCEEREYALADLILAPSEFAIETFLARGVPSWKLALKGYGFAAQTYASHAGRRANEQPVFAFVGRCEPRKGLHLALEAWRASGIAERSRFKILGDFIPEYRERLRPLLDHPNISIEGFARDLRPVYKAADVLVLPSLEDGSALVTYEAQASGCALLVSEAAGARLTDGVQGFVHRVGDVETLAAQMKALADNPQLLESMQRAAADNAQHYTWERCAEGLIQTYQAALKMRCAA